MLFMGSSEVCSIFQFKNQEVCLKNDLQAPAVHDCLVSPCWLLNQDVCSPRYIRIHVISSQTETCRTLPANDEAFDCSDTGEAPAEGHILRHKQHIRSRAWHCTEQLNLALRAANLPPWDEVLRGASDFLSGMSEPSVFLALGNPPVSTTGQQPQPSGPCSPRLTSGHRPAVRVGELAENDVVQHDSVAPTGSRPAQDCRPTRKDVNKEVHSFGARAKELGSAQRPLDVDELRQKALSTKKKTVASIIVNPMKSKDSSQDKSRPESARSAAPSSKIGEKAVAGTARDKAASDADRGFKGDRERFDSRDRDFPRDKERAQDSQRSRSGERDYRRERLRAQDRERSRSRGCPRERDRSWDGARGRGEKDSYGRRSERDSRDDKEKELERQKERDRDRARDGNRSRVRRDGHDKAVERRSSRGRSPRRHDSRRGSPSPHARRRVSPSPRGSGRRRSRSVGRSLSPNPRDGGQRRSGANLRRPSSPTRTSGRRLTPAKRNLAKRELSRDAGDRRRQSPATRDMHRDCKVRVLEGAGGSKEKAGPIMTREASPAPSQGHRKAPEKSVAPAPSLLQAAMSSGFEMPNPQLGGISAPVAAPNPPPSHPIAPAKGVPEGAQSLTRTDVSKDAIVHQEARGDPSEGHLGSLKAPIQGEPMKDTPAAGAEAPVPPQDMEAGGSGGPRAEVPARNTAAGPVGGGPVEVDPAGQGGARTMAPAANRAGKRTISLPSTVEPVPSKEMEVYSIHGLADKADSRHGQEALLNASGEASQQPNSVLSSGMPPPEGPPTLLSLSTAPSTESCQLPASIGIAAGLEGLGQSKEAAGSTSSNGPPPIPPKRIVDASKEGPVDSSHPHAENSTTSGAGRGSGSKGWVVRVTTGRGTGRGARVNAGPAVQPVSNSGSDGDVQNAVAQPRRKPAGQSSVDVGVGEPQPTLAAVSEDGRASIPEHGVSIGAVPASSGEPGIKDVECASGSPPRTGNVDSVAAAPVRTGTASVSQSMEQALEGHQPCGSQSVLAVPLTETNAVVERTKESRHQPQETQLAEQGNSFLDGGRAAQGQPGAEAKRSKTPVVFTLNQASASGGPEASGTSQQGLHSWAGVGAGAAAGGKAGTKGSAITINVPQRFQEVRSSPAYHLSMRLFMQ